MKSDKGEPGDATPDHTTDPIDSTNPVDSIPGLDNILARFDAAIEKLQQPTPAELEPEPEPEPEVAVEAAVDDTAEYHPDPRPDLEIAVTPITDAIDVAEETDVTQQPDVTEEVDVTEQLDVTEELADALDDDPEAERRAREARKAVPLYQVPDLPAEHDPDALLSIRDLTKTFDGHIAVEKVSLDIHPGHIVGIVGPNGAGKTTTLSMATGMLRPDTGSVLIAGHDIWKEPDLAKTQLGIVPDRMRVFDRLTGAQLLHYSGVLRGLEPDTVRERAGQIAATLGIDDALGRLVDNYSSGMKKKLALATALIHSPKVLVLDEPFEAVDPVSVSSVVNILRQFAAAGGAVVLSSHSLGLIEDLCDEVAVIVEGRVIAAGTVDDVRGDDTLENRFIALVRDDDPAEDMEWLHTFSA